jgi:glycerophosphoryl diester phosphodiesterase
VETQQVRRAAVTISHMNIPVTLISMVLAAAPGNWTVRGHVPQDQFVVQAHRGAGVLAPENCVAAFELGWKLNCVPEADVRTTSDGVIVAFHDGDFSRVVVNVTPEMAKKGVADVTFDEVEKLDVGKGQRVQRLSDMFHAMSGKPERRMYLDIKNVDFEQLAREVKEAGVESQVILASPKHAEIKKWKKLVPQSQTLLWMGASDDGSLEKKFDAVRKANFESITQLQIHTHLRDDLKSIERDTPDPFKESDAYLRARGDELREHGILYQTLPYGAKAEEPAVYWKLLDLGLMSFATDHPDVTWDVVKQYYAEGVK